MINLCAPAIIYLIFSITQILIDSLKGLYNTVIMKSIVTIMVTLLLNILCEKGLNVISWIIVFIPFILMTVIVSMLLYVFGLDPSTGKIKTSTYSTDQYGNILIYDPEYNPNTSPIFYNYPNIIIPNPTKNNVNSTSTYSNVNLYTPNNNVFPTSSSSPAYQS
jgi:hypothetical protein